MIYLRRQRRRRAFVLMKSRSSGVSGGSQPPRIFSLLSEANTFFGVDKVKQQGAFYNWWNDLSPEEQNSLVTYTMRYYADINYLLRFGEEKYRNWVESGKGHWGKDATANISLIKDHVARIEKAMDSFRLRENIVIWRGGNKALVGGADTVEALNAMKGAIVRDKGVLSGAVTERGAWGKDGKNIGYEIEIPKGRSRGCFIDPKSSHSGEEEFMVRPGTMYRVLGGYTDKNGNVICRLKAVYRIKDS